MLSLMTRRRNTMAMLSNGRVSGWPSMETLHRRNTKQCTGMHRDGDGMRGGELHEIYIFDTGRLLVVKLRRNTVAKLLVFRGISCVGPSCNWPRPLRPSSPCDHTSSRPWPPCLCVSMCWVLVTGISLTSCWTWKVVV